MPNKAPPTKITPTLAQFSVPRTGTAEMIGRYSAARDVWVVDDGDTVRAIVEVRTDIADTSTSTKVNAEHDDTDVSPLLEIATQTSTAVRAEADDQDHERVARTLLMVTTKTDAQLERDDVTQTLQALGARRSSGVPVGGIPIH